MKVKRIDLDDEQMPARIQVELSHDEATYLAVLLGQQTGDQDQQVMPGGSDLSTDIYEGLVFGVFNRFYSSGVDGAVQAARRGTT